MPEWSAKNASPVDQGFVDVWRTRVVAQRLALAPGGELVVTADAVTAVSPFVRVVPHIPADDDIPMSRGR